MKFKVTFALIIIEFVLYAMVMFILPQKQPMILSPLARTGVAFPTPTLTPSPVPTLPPTPTLTPMPTPTPIPSPTLTPVPLTSSDLETLFTKYANLYSVSKDLLRKIAACESNFNTNAANGDYLGLFQFSSGAWINSRALMGQDGDLKLRASAEEAIKTAAFKISRGEVSAWPNCSK